MTHLSDQIIALSDEYVLGVLTQTEGALIEEVMARDPELARRVGALRDRFLPLDRSATPQDLPPEFITQVRAELAAQDRPLFVSAPPHAANQPSAPRKWRLGLVAAALVGLAVGIGSSGLKPVPNPTVVAVLVDAAGVPQAVIDDYGNDTAFVRFVAPVTVPADRTLQVWTLPSEQMGATSLGTLDQTAATRLRFQDLPPPNAQQLYEVTLEPLGGSPTGRPTGPIIGKGFAASQV
ncbi:anti-sigma factor [Celeribacter baekdonensis]|uniref:Anti-sigma factor n=1 Tax=Celeribacter baekdonensis TaxID=875171 RepID=A0A2R4M1V0_9RHOB|nr:anti-sigma factor [Celeribacter baekdonensis]AVW91141.1 anti-sigma factor [Celeribacter baekdonensis]